MLHAGSVQLRSAPEVDARHLHVECPQHPGITLPVTAVRLTYSNHGGRVVALYLEVLCRYCDKYHYVKVKEGSVADLSPLPWNA